MSLDRPKPLPYRYEFRRDELVEIKRCHDEHGFAVVKEFIPHAWVEELKAAVRRVFETLANPAAGSTTFCTDFVEQAEEMVRLLRYEPFMNLHKTLYGTDELTVNRSAALFKRVGAPEEAYHTDWAPPDKRPRGTDSVLNTTGAASPWLYLTGTHPMRGGLTIVPDSHTPDWPGPKGYELTEHRKFFYRKDDPEKKLTSGYDFDEAFPVFSDPGDLLIFAERTYHGVCAHHGPETRLSCAMSLRPGRSRPAGCWPLPESAKKFIASLPADLQPLVEGYTGIVRDWRGE
jgi:hypothetical protein